MDRETPKDRHMHRRTNTHTHTHTYTEQTCLHTTFFFSPSLRQKLFQPIIRAGTWRVNSCSVSVPQRFYLEPFGLGWNFCTLFCRIKCMPAMWNSSLSLREISKTASHHTHARTHTHTHTHIWQDCGTFWLNNIPLYCGLFCCTVTGLKVSVDQCVTSCNGFHLNTLGKSESV